MNATKEMLKKEKLYVKYYMSDDMDGSDDYMVLCGITRGKDNNDDFYMYDEFEVTDM